MDRHEQTTVRSDAKGCDILSGSTLFATHPVLDTSTCSKMDLFKLKDSYGLGVQVSHYLGYTRSSDEMDLPYAFAGSAKLATGTSSLRNA